MEVDFGLSSTHIDPFATLQMETTRANQIFISSQMEVDESGVLMASAVGGVGGEWPDLCCGLRRPAEYAVLFVWRRLETCRLPKVQGKYTELTPEWGREHESQTETQ